MDLLNRTPFAAAFLNTVISEDRLLGAVVVKPVYQVLDGQLAPDHDRAWPVGGEAVPTDFGEVEGDTPFLREGVDLIVLAKAYPAERSSGPTIVSIRAPALQYDIRVTGDRKWVKSTDGSLVPSQPLPFASMPLTWDRAYGGKAKVDAGDMPFDANPAGRGFYLDAAEAAEQPLPNLEDPADPVRAWNDQREPRGCAPYPKDWSLRARRSAEFDLSGPVPRVVRLKPAYFNNANPKLILPASPRGGEMISISNVRPGGAGLRFAMPDAAFHVYVQLQDRPYVFPAHLESIVVLAEEQRVVLGYKCVFRYRMIPLERRMAVLYSGVAPATPPAECFIRWDEPGKPANA